MYPTDPSFILESAGILGDSNMRVSQKERSVAVEMEKASAKGFVEKRTVRAMSVKGFPEATVNNLKVSGEYRMYQHARLSTYADAASILEGKGVKSTVACGLTLQLWSKR